MSDAAEEGALHGACDAEAGAGSDTGQSAGGRLRRFCDSYGLVFALIVATLLATALVDDARWARVLTSGLMTVTLLLTLRASRVPGEHWGALGAVVLAAVAVISAALGESALEQLVPVAAGAGFMVAAVAASVRRVRTHAAVTMQTVMGALCVYLFIGLFFAVVYGGVDLADSDPFFAHTDAPAGLDFVSCSFITQAAVGYGDLTPATDLGRMLAVTETLLGRICLVTIVAVLVGNLGRQRRSVGLLGGCAEAEQPAGSGGRAEPPDGGG